MKTPSSRSVQKIGLVEVVEPAARDAFGGTTRSVAGRPAAPARGDGVQIAAAGRTLRETVGEVDREALTPGRVSEIRQRILARGYDSASVVDQVARSILDRGDA